MALIKCPECQKLISDTIDTCPRCGYKITPEKLEELRREQERNQRKEKRMQKGCGIGCLSVFVLFMIIFLCPSHHPRDWEIVGTQEWAQWKARSWLIENLNDPGSLEIIRWSAVAKTDEGYFLLRVKYRAKNSFGGYVVENNTLQIDSSGRVFPAGF